MPIEPIDALMARASNADNFASIADFGAVVSEVKRRLLAGDMPSDGAAAERFALRMQATYRARRSRVC